MKNLKEIQPIALPLGRQSYRIAFAVWLGLSLRG